MAKKPRQRPVASILGHRQSTIATDGAAPGIDAQKPLRASKARRTSTEPPSILSGLREAEFQRIVRDALKKRGYTVWVFPIMKRTTAGVPDLTFWHPQRPGWLYCWELKTEKGRIGPKQVEALAHLATVPGIDARIVRPSDWLLLSLEV